MSQLKLYKTDMTPPSQAAMMVTDALGLKVTFVDVDLQNGGHLAPDYIKINPMHTVPTLQDGEFIVSDSHAIAAYLVTVYGKDDSLCPKDPKQRATVDQRLHFDNGILYTRMRLFFNALRNGTKESELPQDMRDMVVDGYGLLEAYLNMNTWLAGDNMTIADLCAVTSLAASDVIEPFDRTKFPKTSAWWDKMAALPYYKTRCAAMRPGLVAYYNHLVATNNAN